MTISYHGSFFKLLVRWKGSMWKDCWIEVVIFLLLYYLLSIVYRLALNDVQRTHFESLCVSINAQTKQIPLTFLLGFFVSTIVKRWWDQFERLPWPDDLMCLTCSVIPGNDADAVLKRRIIARYVNLATALCWRDISVPIFKRFYEIPQFVNVGLMTDEEMQLYQRTQVSATRWFSPLQWCQKIVEKDAETRKTPANVVQSFIRELGQFRKQLRSMYCFDWVCVPMVYTQVVTIATYGYFFLCLFGRQFLDPTKRYREFEADFYVPVMTILQLIFYVGWYKVAEHLISPFGEDDDDLELSYLLDRNIRVSFAIVEQLYEQEPALQKATLPLIHNPRLRKPVLHPMKGRKINDLLLYSRQTALVKLAERPPKGHVTFNSVNLPEWSTSDAADQNPLTEAEMAKSNACKNIREF